MPRMPNAPKTHLTQPSINWQRLQRVSNHRSFLVSCQNSKTGASRLVWSKKRNKFKTGEKSNSLNFLLFFATIKASRIISPCQNSRPHAWSQKLNIQKMQSMFTSPPPTLYLATTKVFCDIMSCQGSETGATRLCKVKEMERTRERKNTKFSWALQQPRFLVSSHRNTRPGASRHVCVQYVYVSTRKLVWSKKQKRFQIGKQKIALIVTGKVKQSLFLKLFLIALIFRVQTLLIIIFIIRALWKEAATLRDGYQRLQTPKQKISEQLYFFQSESIDNHWWPHHDSLECGNKSERFNLFLPATDRRRNLCTNSMHASLREHHFCCLYII